MMAEPMQAGGNPAADAFAEALGFDVTTAALTCGSCCRTKTFAESHIYSRGPGIVVCCPGCEGVLARLVQTRTDVWLDFRGAQSWRFPIPTR